MKLVFRIEEMTKAGAWRLTIQAENPEELEKALSVVESLRKRFTTMEEEPQVELRFPGRAEFPLGLRRQDEILVL